MIVLTALLITLMAAASTTGSRRAPGGASVVGISLAAWAAIAVLAALEFTVGTPAP
jgi:hypothetical protein